MKPDEIKHLLGDTPHMSLEKAHKITNLIHENDIKNILELGFAHGVSTCYMAAALEESGGSTIITIDREEARLRTPNIEHLIKKCGYSHMVTFYYEPTSYIWRLKKLLEEDPTPRFDLCYIDGAHSWYVDGFAFFLVDRLLRPDGWIIFDDLYWTYADSPALQDTEAVKNMPQEERKIPHIKNVYDLLVKTHYNYDEFRISDDWAYAHKVNGSTINKFNEVRREIIYIELLKIRRLISHIKWVFQKRKKS